jgi:hypothetical protein
MKIIAFERADGRVAISRVTFGYVFGMQAGLGPDKIVELQRALFGITPEEIAELETQFIVGKNVNIKSDDSPKPAVDLKLTVLVTADEVIEGHAQDLLKASGGKFKRFVLLEEADLPARDSRETWCLDGDRVVAA